jgi:predicted transcriptional regulator
MNYRELSKLKNAITEEILKAMDEKKPNISKLAKDVGVSRNTIYNIKNGSVPNLTTINKLREILNNY